MADLSPDPWTYERKSTPPGWLILIRDAHGRVIFRQNSFRPYGATDEANAKFICELSAGPDWPF